MKKTTIHGQIDARVESVGPWTQALSDTTPPIVLYTPKSSAPSIPLRSDLRDFSLSFVLNVHAKKKRAGWVVGIHRASWPKCVAQKARAEPYTRRERVAIPLVSTPGRQIGRGRGLRYLPSACFPFVVVVTKVGIVLGTLFASADTKTRQNKRRRSACPSIRDTIFYF